MSCLSNICMTMPPKKTGYDRILTPEPRPYGRGFFLGGHGRTRTGTELGEDLVVFRPSEGGTYTGKGRIQVD
jgi:hypothetical protein